MAKSKKAAQAEPVSDATQSHEAHGIVIQGLVFPVSTPYAEGHTINEAEANTLNQVRSENLRNNFANQVKKAKEAPKGLTEEAKAALAEAFAKYDAEYVFAGKRMSKTPVDPVAREAHKIAKSKILEQLRKKNIDPKSLAEGKMDDLIAGVLSKYPSITEEAQRRVAASKSVADELLSDEDLAA
jgi:hypothetical protein